MVCFPKSGNQNGIPFSHGSKIRFISHALSHIANKSLPVQYSLTHVVETIQELLSVRLIPGLITMKKIFFLLAVMLGSSSIFANCTNAYASAGYTLSHAKKSMEANNFEHQQYYAERALSALEKTRDENETCGCPGAIDPILDGIENLNASLSQEKWDDARYYTKKAIEDAQKVLYSLDMCAQGEETPKQDNPEGLVPETEDSSVTLESKEAEAWTAKLLLRQNAEDELILLEKSIRNMASLFECQRALQIVREQKVKSDEELRKEELSTLKSYYMSQAVALHNKALFALLECAKR